MITSLLLAIQINLAIIFHKTAEESTAFLYFSTRVRRRAPLRGVNKNREFKMRNFVLFNICPFLISCLPIEPLPTTGYFLHNQCPYDIEYHTYTPNLKSSEQGYINNKLTIPSGDRKSFLVYSNYSPNEKGYTEFKFIKGNIEVPYNKIIDETSNVKRIYITTCPNDKS